MMWNWRLLLATGEARYADLLERSLYNGFLSGVSLDGRRYFYVNVLQSRGGIERPEWYGCACCPPNVMRQIAMVAHYAATVGEEGVQIHQYIPVAIEAGGEIGPAAKLHLDTDYPWDGAVCVTVDEADGSAWELALRVPGWCAETALKVNGETQQSVTGGQYSSINRVWQAGDVVELELAMDPAFVEAHPRVDAIRDNLCIQRGPMVYCLEQVDQPDLDLLDVRVAPDAPMQAQRCEDLLGGVVAIEVQGLVTKPGEWDDSLYLPAAEREIAHRTATLTAVPYYAWANREIGTMRVWIPRPE
jgi:hypothetical protein